METTFLIAAPKLNQPFDLMVTCNVDNFKIYVNGQLASSTITSFHSKQVAGVPVTPIVTAIGYDIATGSNMKITRISWNYSELRSVRRTFTPRNKQYFASFVTKM